MLLVCGLGGLGFALGLLGYLLVARCCFGLMWLLVFVLICLGLAFLLVVVSVWFGDLMACVVWV